ncbi:unnamed protein product [Cyprideis torosa]|uniref:Uncharacterized protein n=1 Tax=Cyprideis torosa TaxID=163714 RepID=A0A7R8W7F3_9CRUS|nr:unnamed protein product [Cyprideis torosa]CAG0886257.1 unnamed protein product [Cyprideis torosa]
MLLCNRCSQPSSCKVSQVSGKPECACPDCSDDNYPVCGTDGKTYGNRCLLLRTACQEGRQIHAVSDGRCPTKEICRGVDCTPPRKCRPDAEGRPSCVCPDFCPSIEEPVCGSDGQTYPSICHLRIQACRSNQMISVISNADCRVPTLIPSVEESTSPNIDQGYSYQIPPPLSSTAACISLVSVGEDGKMGRRIWSGVKIIPENVVPVGGSMASSACDKLNCPPSKMCFMVSLGDPDCQVSKTCTKVPLCIDQSEACQFMDCPAGLKLPHQFHLPPEKMPRFHCNERLREPTEHLLQLSLHLSINTGRDRARAQLLELAPKMSRVKTEYVNLALCV